MAIHYYDNGLPFSSILNTNSIDLNTRVTKNKASMIIIDGGVGEGKTTLGVELADNFNKLNGLEPVSLEVKNHPQLALGGLEFMQNLRYCFENKLPAIVYDESGDFNKRGSLTRFNAMLNRSFETFRGFRVVVILCLPCVGSLDNEIFLKNIPRLLLHVENRGDDYGDFSGYSLFRMFYIKDKMKKLVVPSFAYNLVEPNFRGHFLNLEPRRSEQLDKVSTAGKLEILKKSEIIAEGLISYREMASKLGRSIIWVRSTILKERIKPVKIINRAKYFNEDTLNRLSDLIDGLG